jgi:hypothetical protein
MNLANFLCRIKVLAAVSSYPSSIQEPAQKIPEINNLGLNRVPDNSEKSMTWPKMQK